MCSQIFGTWPMSTMNSMPMQPDAFQQLQTMIPSDPAQAQQLQQNLQQQMHYLMPQVYPCPQSHPAPTQPKATHHRLHSPPCHNHLRHRRMSQPQPHHPPNRPSLHIHTCHPELPPHRGHQQLGSQTQIITIQTHCTGTCSIAKSNPQLGPGKRTYKAWTH